MSGSTDYIEDSREYVPGLQGQTILGWSPRIPHPRSDQAMLVDREGREVIPFPKYR